MTSPFFWPIIRLHNPNTRGKEGAKLKFYRNTFFITILAAAIIVFTGQLLFSAYTYRSFTQHNADQALISQTSNQAAMLGEQLMLMAGQSITSTSLLRQPEISADQDIISGLQEFLSLNDLIQGIGVCRVVNTPSAIYVFRKQGVVQTTGISAEQMNQIFAGSYEKANSNPDNVVRWSGDNLPLLGNTRIVSAIMPIYEGNQLLGYSRLDLSIEAMQSYVKNIKLGDSGFAFIAHSKADFTRYLGKGQAGIKDQSDLDDLAETAINSSGSSFYQANLGGKDINIAVSPVGATGLKMVFVLPQNEAYSGMNNLLIQSFLSLFFAFLVFFIIFYVIMQRNIDTPIGDLIKTVHDFASGDSEAPMRYSHRNNEQMSVLLDSIVSMPKNIMKLVEDLKLKNQEIIAQHDRIAELYEETSKMNNELSEAYNEKVHLYQRLHDSYLDTVHALANAIEASDHYTQGHCQRVKDYSLAIARAMNIDEADLPVLEYAALLHDVGKIGIMPSILNKTAELDQVEYQQMANHPIIGFNILSGIESLDKCRMIVLQHHEHWDGGGYPGSLKGEEIHLLSRIITVADSFDAMTSSRPYRRKPLSRENAMDELVKNKGRQFDPHIVDVFIDLLMGGLFVEWHTRTG